MASETLWFTDLYNSVVSGNAVAAVAVSGGRVVGLCDVGRRSGAAESHVGVLGIALRKEYRGQGLGRRLITYCLEKCVGVFEIVTLEVFSNNVRAVKLYTPLGCKQ
ncbi:MAG: GNAT family N-acetyltransferase [Thermoprotei archaeon]